ncbi:hypothetical protein [Curtobacterium herbarum]|uniref:Uncharacterized protein n=1 Tax=Curtobacterium herbarum TaxID=150122 RepID=A0ABP4K200_9MICO|nr:hypothetical protein [Curtobacterium herbarum]MBM7474078.1 hypothetical protein [Curtobacterium herbarum]MCS6544598.1 hypothetical protein [Curtobacterium herbarum]
MDIVRRGKTDGANAGSGGHGRIRQSVVGLLTVVATLGCCVVGVMSEGLTIRGVAAVVTVAAMAGSLALARGRGNLVGWYVAAAGVALLRVLSGS